LKNSKFYFVVAIFWLLLISFLLCLPGTEFPKITWLTRIWLDKWVHIFIFFILVITWCRAFREKVQVTLSKNICLQIAVFSLLYGIVMEVVQHYFIPFRGFESGDILADGLGCAGGYIFSRRRWIKK
jgi:VanZ family protein